MRRAIRPACDLDFRHYCTSAIRWPCSPDSHCGVFRAVSGAFDQYLVVYAVASMVVFNTASVFDTVAVSRLVRIREDAGDDAFWRSSNKLLLQAMLGGLLFAAGLFALVHLLMPIIAAGFSADERAAVAELTIYFAPWVLVVIPYYAVSALS